jgi:hypothetical protein
MAFDLDNLLQHDVDLSSLEEPFSQEEIDYCVEWFGSKIQNDFKCF